MSGVAYQRDGAWHMHWPDNVHPARDLPRSTARIAELEREVEWAHRQREKLSIDLDDARRQLDDARRDRDVWRDTAKERGELQDKAELRYSSKCREELERSNAEWRAFRVAVWIFGTVIGSASVGFAFWAVVELWIGTLGRLGWV